MEHPLGKEAMIARMSLVLLPTDLIALSMMLKFKENIHAIQVSCKICEGTYLTQEFPLRNESKTIEQVKENTDLNLEKLDAVTKNLEVKVEKLTQAVLTNEGNTVVKVNANMEKAREVKKEPVPRDLPIFNPYVLPIPFPGHLKEQEDDPYITYESVCTIGFSKRTHEEDLKLLIAKYT
ncbi:hypothetical protein Tco_0266941 [Tanacetum coccineum]